MKRAAIAANLGGELTASCKRTRTAVRAAHPWYRKGRRGSPVIIISQWRILPKVLMFQETALLKKQAVFIAAKFHSRANSPSILKTYAQFGRSLRNRSLSLLV